MNWDVQYDSSEDGYVIRGHVGKNGRIYVEIYLAMQLRQYTYFQGWGHSL